MREEHAEMGQDLLYRVGVGFRQSGHLVGTTMGVQEQNAATRPSGLDVQLRCQGSGPMKAMPVARDFIVTSEAALLHHHQPRAQLGRAAQADKQFLTVTGEDLIHRAREFVRAAHFGCQRSHCDSTARASASGSSDAGSQPQLNDQVPNTSMPITDVAQLFGTPPDLVRMSPSTKCYGRPCSSLGSMKATRDRRPVPLTGWASSTARTWPPGCALRSTAPSFSSPAMN